MHKGNPIFTCTAVIAVLFLFLAVVNCAPPSTNNKKNTNKKKTQSEGVVDQNVPKRGNKSTLKKLDTAISFENTKVQYKLSDATFTQQAKGGGKITYTSSDPKIATVITTGEVRFVKAGTVRIIAEKGEDEASYELTIANSLPELRYAYTEVVQGFTLIPYTNSSIVTPAGREEVSYTSGDTVIATVDSATGAVRFVKLGTVKITARKGESEASYDLTIEQGAGTTLSFGSPTIRKSFTEGTYRQEVTEAKVAGDDGAITYTSGDAAIATVHATTGEVRFVKAGKVRITATKAGTAGKYKAQTAWYELTIEGAGTTLSFGSPTIRKSFTEGTYTQEVTKAEVADDAGAISYTSRNTAIATVHPTTGLVTFVKLGTVTITATKAGTAGKYKAQTASYDLTIEQGAGTTLSFGSPTIRKSFTEGTYTQEVTKAEVADDAGAISYTSRNTAIATVHPTTGLVTFVKLGTVRITATKAETAGKYKEQEASYELTIRDGFWRKISDAPWTAREGFASVVFDDKLWVMGGQKQEGELNDVWYSTDGTTWIEATPNAQWADREGLTSVVFDDKIYVMGGCSGTNADTDFGPEGNNCRSNTQTYYNDVWSSSNGINWDEEVRNTPNDDSGTMWDTRAYHTTVVFNGKIYVIGGSAKNSHKWPDLKGMYVNDIWSSANGSTWTRAAQTQTRERWHFYYIGTRPERLRKLADGKDGRSLKRRFEKFTNKKGFTYWNPRYGHASEVFDDKIWIIGGSIGAHQPSLKDASSRVWTVEFAQRRENWPWKSAYKNDVYSSGDGDIWTKELSNGTAGWSARRNHATVVFGDKIYLIGGRTVGTGKDRVSKNDVWYSTDGTTWEELTIDETFMSERDNFQAVVFKGKLYVMGGGAKKEGVTWTYDAEDVDEQYNDVWAYGSWDD